MLKIDGQPAAFLYGYHCQGNVLALRTGFDSSLGGGMGSALLLKTIEDSCDRGDRMIDFGPGEREHKRRLRTRTESTYRLTYTPMTPGVRKRCGYPAGPRGGCRRRWKGLRGDRTKPRAAKKDLRILVVLIF